MAVALIVLCGALVLLGAVPLVWRRVVDERRSVRDYQQTLNTLRTVSGRSGQVQVRPIGERQRPPARAAAAPGEGDGAAVPGGDGGVAVADGAVVRGGDGGVAMADGVGDGRGAGLRDSPVGDDLGPRGRDAAATGDQGAGADAGTEEVPVLVFDDVAPSPAPTVRAAAAENDPALRAMAKAAGAPVVARGSGRSAAAGPRRAVRAVSVAAAVLLLVGLAAIGASLVHTGHGGSSGAVAPGGSRAAEGAHPRSTGASGSAPRPAGSAVAGSAVHPTTATLYAATVAAPASAYTVVVSATGNCWIEGQRTDTGQDVWSGTLTAGEQHTFSFAGPVLLRIGAANAAVTLDGVPVALPSGYQAPYNVTFTPA